MSCFATFFVSHNPNPKKTHLNAPFHSRQKSTLTHTNPNSLCPNQNQNQNNVVFNILPFSLPFSSHHHQTLSLSPPPLRLPLLGLPRPTRRLPGLGLPRPTAPTQSCSSSSRSRSRSVSFLCRCGIRHFARASPRRLCCFQERFPFSIRETVARSVDCYGHSPSSKRRSGV